MLIQKLPARKIALDYRNVVIKICFQQLFPEFKHLLFTANLKIKIWTVHKGFPPPRLFFSPSRHV